MGIWKIILAVKEYWLSLYSQNDKDMTNTTTPSVIKVTTGTMSGDVFYGSFDTTVKNKRVSVMVSNHIKDENKE